MYFLFEIKRRKILLNGYESVSFGWLVDGDSHPFVLYLFCSVNSFSAELCISEKYYLDSIKCQCYIGQG